MRHIFMINPNAGKKDQSSRLFAMAERLRSRHGLDCSCILSKRPGSRGEMARKLAETGEALRFYACGGDGTIFELCNGIAGYENAAMSCIPTGTGNDFLKNFGGDQEKFLDAENLWDGPSMPLDLIDCNGRLCLTIACSGIDARIADSVHRYSGTPGLNGRGSYLASVAVNFLFKPIGRHWTVYLDEERLEDDFALVSMVNGRYYGGGSTPVPWARLDDGLLHTVLVKNVPRHVFAKLFPAYSAGAQERLPKELFRCSEAKVVRSVSPGEDIVTCLDGESLRSREVTLRLSEKRLNFFGPKGCSPNATAAERKEAASFTNIS